MLVVMGVGMGICNQGGKGDGSAKRGKQNRSTCLAWALHAESIFAMSASQGR